MAAFTFSMATCVQLCGTQLQFSWQSMGTRGDF